MPPCLNGIGVHHGGVRAKYVYGVLAKNMDSRAAAIYILCCWFGSRHLCGFVVMWYMCSL